jgi:hypothetical protein
VPVEAPVAASGAALLDVETGRGTTPCSAEVAQKSLPMPT